MLLGIVLIVTSKNKNFEHDIKATGFGLIVATIILFVPMFVQNIITNIKEKAIIQYIEGDVEVITHSDSTYTFLWIDCD